MDVKDGLGDPVFKLSVGQIICKRSTCHHWPTLSVLGDKIQLYDKNLQEQSIRKIQKY